MKLLKHGLAYLLLVLSFITSYCWFN